MLDKFLKEVVIIVVGKQAEPIANLLDNKKHVNEFIIAKKMDITINQTRNILYRLADQGLVSSIRKKDKKKGWYTYFWKFEILKVLEFLKQQLEKKTTQLKNLLNSRKTKQFYVCERCQIEFNEENALLNDFTCKECGNIFVMKNSKKEIQDIERTISRFARELKVVNEEIDKESERLEKIKLKEIKKIEKEKADKRSAARKKSAIERAKNKPKKSSLLSKKKKKVRKGSRPPTRKKKVVKKKKKKVIKRVPTRLPKKKKIIKKIVKKKKKSSRPNSRARSKSRAKMFRGHRSPTLKKKVIKKKKKR